MERGAPLAYSLLPSESRVTYRQQYTKCNRSGCGACMPDQLGHGPYWYAYWRENGRLRSRYLGKEAPSQLIAVDTAAHSAAPAADDPEVVGEQGTPRRRPPIPELRVQTLGAFAVWVRGRRIPEGAWNRRKAAALFKALLSASGCRLHREQAAELLWPDSDPSRADNNLRFTLHHLRTILDAPDTADSFVLARDGLLILAAIPGMDEGAGQTHPEDWLDAARFCTEAARALAAVDPLACQAALASYTGPYLPDDRYEDWALPRGEEISRLRIALLLHHARLVETGGAPEDRVHAWQALLAADSCHEEAAYSLMRALAERGRAAEALRIYHTFAVALRAELDVSPAAAIERLRASLSADQQPDAAVSANLAPGSAAVIESGSPKSLTNLPAPMTSFIGRLYEQSIVQELLLGTRLLTLTGIGGSGKTRLALHVATAMGVHFPDGIWLVELATLSDPASVLELVSKAVGVLDLPPNLPLLAGLARHLQGRRLLLVLDNCEHLLGACAELAGALLSSCVDLRVLATSRESLDLPGETTFRVPPLSLPLQDSRPSPRQLLEFEAVQLFVERARAHRPGFALTDRNARAVRSICTRLDGLPLAIELAAARIRSLSVEDIDSRLDQRFQVLTGGPRTALPRHQTLRAALDWSYDLLSVPERALLRRLSVFAGGWTLDAAEAIGAGEPVGNWEVLDVLSMLADKSLVELDERDSGSRYWLQETMRQYASEKLMADNEIAQVHERHLIWCLRLAEEGSEALQGARQLLWLDRLTAEHDNLRAALSWCTAVETQHGAGPAAALRLAGALWRFWWMRGFPYEGRRWLEIVLADPNPMPTQLRARALDGAGVLAADQGDYGRARALHEESLTLWRTAGDLGAVAGALNNLGSVAQQQGDHQLARALHEESLLLWRALKDAPGAASALNQLACIARDDQGDYARARSLLEESLTLRRSLGDTRGMAISLNNLGLVAYYEGDHAQANPLLEESLTLRQSLGDTRGIANSLGNLGRVAIGQGNSLHGADLYRQSLALRREQGDRRGIVECLEGLAMAASMQGAPARATRLLGAAEAIREEIGSPRPLPMPDLPDHAMAALCLALGDAPFASIWAGGRALGLERAIMLAGESADAGPEPESLQAGHGQGRR